ncbi:MAG: ComEC/Rec2 family competence protein [Armatimonadota bacterium]
MGDFFRKWLTWLRRIAPERLVLLGLLLAAVGLWAGVVFSLPRPLEVVAFAVGDGDALLIRTPSGRTALIDGGSRSIPQVGEHVLAPNLLLLGVRRIDVMILTHPDSDHLNGLPAVLANLPTGRFLDTDPPCENTSYQRIREYVRRHAIPHDRLRAGSGITLDHETRLRVLSPTGQSFEAPGDTNNGSVVCLLEYRGARMLFTGDLEAEGEQALLSRKASLRADVLKVGHHGSKTATSEAFLRAVRPRWAVISCSGNSSSGFPHPEVLARLRAHNTRFFRTDVSGQIRLTTYGGGEWRVKTFR